MLQFRGKQIEKVIEIKTYNGYTPLMVAIEEKAENIFEYLLNESDQTDFKAQDDDGLTALHRAIVCKDEKKAK